jgi:hypothetical protein
MGLISGNIADYSPPNERATGSNRPVHLLNLPTRGVTSNFKRRHNPFAVTHGDE